jgi:excisionase family DNA binding protein
VAGVSTASQALDNTEDPRSPAVEDLPRDVTNGADGKPFAGQVAADLRRTELLRPEDLLPVTAVARRLGVSVATVHAAINAGKLRCHLFGVARRVRQEDLEAYVQARADDGPPADQDWRTVRELMRAAEVSRSQAYRLVERGVVPFQVFAGVRYIRGEDIAAFARSRKRID